jgi:4'-phosphopantetheinyl transferase EntD
MTSAPFSVAFEREHPYGVLIGVDLPPSKLTVPDDVLGQLVSEEQSFARALRGFRQAQWVGGRLGWRAVAKRLGHESWPLLTDAAGAPMSPPGTSISISHKKDLAVVLVSTEAGVSVGVDLEDDSSAAEAIAHLVFGPEERAALDALSGWRDRAKVLAFSVKESVYKALAPVMKRVLRYDEAMVWVGAGGVASVTMRLVGAPRQPQAELWYEWRGARVMTAVRCVMPEATKETQSGPKLSGAPSPRRS